MATKLTTPLVLGLAYLTSAVPSLGAVKKFRWGDDMPPRFQWTHNDGYCGEVSTIMAGLKYGQYYSQVKGGDGV